MHYLHSLTRSRPAKSVYVYTYIVMDLISFFKICRPFFFFFNLPCVTHWEKKGTNSPSPFPPPPWSLSARSFPFTPACPGQYTQRSFWSWMSTIDTFHWLTVWSGQFPYLVAASFLCVDLDRCYGFLSGSHLREQCCILWLPVISLWYVFIVEKNILSIFCT